MTPRTIDVDPETGEVLQEPSPAGRALVRSPAAAELQLRGAVAGILRPVEEPAQLLAAQEETRRLVAEVLEPGRDFGTIPGTDRPTLLQPGAQRIAAAFGVAPRYTVEDREVDHDREVRWVKRKKSFQNGRFLGWSEETGTALGLYRFTVRCELVHRASGVAVGEGLASCSSLEARYTDRPRDAEHTILAIAMKRAMVNAVLSTFALSEQFAAADEEREEDPEAPDPEELAQARARYFARLAEHLPHPRIRGWAREAYQAAHPLFPDSASAWELAHFERAAAELVKFGGSCFERAVRWLAVRDPATPGELEALGRLEPQGAEDQEALDWLRTAGVGSWIRAELDVRTPPPTSEPDDQDDDLPF